MCINCYMIMLDRLILYEINMRTFVTFLKCVLCIIPKYKFYLCPDIDSGDF